MENENGGPWSHPDITLPHLLLLIRSFVDMLLLASGYQPSGLPARWRTDDVQRALSWASLLEEIIKKIPVTMKGKDSSQTLHAALQDLNAEDTFPVGIPRLSCAVLAEARMLLICAMSNTLGSCSGQIESLLMATYNEQKDWDAVLKHLSDRYSGIISTKLLCEALKSASLQFNRDVSGQPGNKCCQQWRQNSLSYALDLRTLYKLSGVTIIFKTNELQWRNILETIRGTANQADVDKTVEISELCCLQLACHNWSILTCQLLQPCQNLSCLRHVQNLCHSINQNGQELESKKHGVDAYLLEMLNGKEELLLNLPPILVAAALRKGSCLFSHYISELSKHINTERSPLRCTSKPCEEILQESDVFFERVWCLQFLEQVTSPSTV